uniref:NADH-quinone oxidoreductase subunit A n=1 Tax=Mycobacterium riyadhense TaxID=486698 RepID=A0A653EED2_9MYCO|nr:NAD(P)H-quinone oxidoreductase subunit 3 [Mycobacterium riyadhense]
MLRPSRDYVEGHCDGPQARSVTAAQPPPGRRAGGPYDGSWSELNVYIPILVLAALAAAFAVVSVVIASLVGPSRFNRSKLAAYECGIEPTDTGARTGAAVPGAAAGQRFPIKYYLTAMLFIVFDIEIVFLYPWAVSYDSLGTFALVEMLVFMLTVFVAYAYVWRRGGLTWD